VVPHLCRKAAWCTVPAMARSLLVRLAPLVLVVALAAAARGQNATLPPPTFAVLFDRLPAGQPLLRVFTVPSAMQGTTRVFRDTFVDATVAPVADGEWELQVRNAGTDPGSRIVEVWFPHDAAPVALGGLSADDVIYTSWIFGMAIHADSAPSTGGSFVRVGGYPGGHVSPLVVLGDGRSARLTAASDWPPRAVVPAFMPNRTVLIRPGLSLGPNASGTWRALSTLDTGDAAAGEPPWLRAVDRYQTWLRPHLESAGLWPIVYPQWLKQAHGWFGVGLMDVDDNSWAALVNVWNLWRDRLPWMQCWGQMSCFHGPQPWPPCYSCCALDRSLHGRYQVPAFDVAAFARTTAAAGWHVGYYSRPWDGYRLYNRLPLPGNPINLDWWNGWLDAQVGWGANAFYLDTVGWLDFGPPLDVATVLRDAPRVRDAVIEGALDLYPTANLVSLCLHYPGAGYPGGPGHTSDDLGPAVPRVPFPQLGTRLLSDHILINGQANTGHELWGSANAYWTERQVFLLGHKYDAFTPYETWSSPGTANLALGLALGLRDRVQWWSREPRYCDRRGITALPAGVDVRRFVDQAGVDLLVIDNWSQLTGRSFRFLGNQVAVPTARLSILEFPGTPCPGDLNGDRRIDALDAGILLRRWQQQVPAGTQGDLDGDGRVDARDLAALQARLGTVCP
jgi:hypothetical protein